MVRTHYPGPAPARTTPTPPHPSRTTTPIPSPEPPFLVRKAHCKSLEQARAVLAAVTERMRRVGLRLHPGKARIVYCKDANRTGSWEHTEFTFLGYEFRERTVKGRHGLFWSFSPAVSRAALKRISAAVRSWRLHRWVTATAGDLAARVNPVVRGWMCYYGAFHPSALYPLLRRINWRAAWVPCTPRALPPAAKNQLLHGPVTQGEVPQTAGQLGQNHAEVVRGRQEGAGLLRALGLGHRTRSRVVTPERQEPWVRLLVWWQFPRGPGRRGARRPGRAAGIVGVLFLDQDSQGVHPRCPPRTSLPCPR